METRERQHSHRTTSGGGSELFICFTSRPSSTSCAAATMRVPSSKSLMSPGRAAAPSLSSSLSRRLRSSGSVKGGEQSPMFPAGVTARKKGCAFEAAEPSSPKVTCIGQVRVKSKKKKKCKAAAGAAMVRSRSQRRSGGEASFRRAVGDEGERECKPWGITVCEALRAFGSEINCFVPCRGGTGRSLCSSSKSSCEEEKRTRSSCGAVFARWMMAVQEGEEGKGGEVVGLVVQESGRREVGLMVGKEEEDVKGEEEEVEEKVVVVKKEVEVEVEVEVVDEGRGSVCVPPKNALLLMRCRSDPVRMAALATRFWGSPNAAKVGAEEAGQTEEEAEEEEEEDGVRVETIAEEKEEGGEELGEDLALAEDKVAEEQEEQEVCETTAQEEEQNKCEDILEGNAEEEKAKDESFTADSTESPAVPLKEEVKVKEKRSSGIIQERRRSRVKDREMRRSRSSKEKERKRNSFSSEREARRHSFSTEREARRPSISMETERRQSWSFSVVREEKKEKKEEEDRNKALDSEKACKVEGEKKRELPDCLLLMMYEPKLSMEVSKETWVCSTDFLQWRPKEAVPAVAAADETQDPVPPLSEEVEKKLFGASDPAPVPAPAPVAYEPFVLTRCKSEPMRSSARLAPDACFWKSRHQPIGAAGIGF